MQENEEHRMLFYSLFQQNKRIGRHLVGLVQRAEQDMGDIHFGLLMWLNGAMNAAGNPERIDVSELTRLSNDRPQNVSRNLRTLENDGLITRSSDPADRRRSYVMLTEKAMQCIANGCCVIESFETRVIEQTGKEKVERILAELEELVNVMDELEPTDKEEKGC